jgi:hypothetical protein
MTNTLHIFALNEPVSVSHTNLTRQQGSVAPLPPLEEWLGIDRLYYDQIEMFPVDELGDMTLSDYVAMAFTPDKPIPADMQTRLNALKGAVLLVPDSALSGTAYPRAQATYIASLDLANADNIASLPKADTARTPAPATAPREPEPSPPIALYALIGMAVLAAVIVMVGWN